MLNARWRNVEQLYLLDFPVFNRNVMNGQKPLPVFRLRIDDESAVTKIGYALSERPKKVKI